MNAESTGRASVLLKGGRQKPATKSISLWAFPESRRRANRSTFDEPLPFVHARTQASLDSVLPVLKKTVEID